MPVPLVQFLKQLEDSGIIADETLQDFIPPKASPKSGDELARDLVKQKKITKYQAEEVYRGNGKSLLLGNYLLLEKIGAGGMGQVFKARHRRMDRLVAVKLLPVAMTKDKAAIARFEREVKAAAKLRHHNIVAADDADCANGVHFLVMELVEGQDLSALVKQHGPFSVVNAVDYILQAARGLEFAHKKGVIHRDIKPANLLLDDEGTVKILDMGLARLGDTGDGVAQAELTNTGMIMGTVDYMAPEQALDTKSAGPQADIYALGCSLYYLLTGKATYDGDTLMKKLLAHREHAIPSLRTAKPDTPEILDFIFRKMVAKKTEDRYQTMSDVISALEQMGPGSQTMVNMPVTANSLLANSDFNLKHDLEATSTFRKSQIIPSTFRTKKNQPSLWKTPLAMIGAALSGILILAGIIVTLQTSDGKLIVEINEADATVQVLDAAGKIEVTQKSGEGKVTISVDTGMHRLKVEKEGFAVFGEEFEMQKNGTKTISAKLIKLEEKSPPKVAEVNNHGWNTPELQQWVKSVSALPADKQITAVSKKLVELNPGFDGKLPYKAIDNHVVILTIISPHVADLSPLQALTHLEELKCEGLKEKASSLSDLTPLKGLPLRSLNLTYTRVADLSPLTGMKLTTLHCTASQVSDLTPLQGMPLQALYCGSLYNLSDLTALRGMPLNKLVINWNNNLTDFSPLADLPLKELDVSYNQLKDFNSLAACKNLEVLQLISTRVTPETIAALHTALPQCKIAWGDHAQIILNKKPLAFQDPAFESWVKETAALSAEKQIEAVSQKLIELNPKFDGTVTGFTDDSLPLVQNGAVVEFGFNSDHVKDISPVRAFESLKRLQCHCTYKNGDVADLSPLKGLALNALNCRDTQVADLSPLVGMPLTELNCSVTKVVDLSPLISCKNLMRVTVTNTKVTAEGVASLQNALPECRIISDHHTKPK
jgi:serine/threonine protein kinase